MHPIFNVKKNGKASRYHLRNLTLPGGRTIGAVEKPPQTAAQTKPVTKEPEIGTPGKGGPSKDNENPSK